MAKTELTLDAKIRIQAALSHVLQVVPKDRLAEIGAFMEGAVKETLAGTRSGRRYRVPGSNRYYTASAAGEPPAARLGRLRTSIGWRAEGNVVAVGSRIMDPPYPVYLEFGTKKMLPRPFMEPTLRAKKAEIIGIMRRPWNA